MKISCKLITKEREHGLPKGKFLEIYLNENKGPFHVDFSDFEKKYKESKREILSPSTEPTVVEKGGLVKQENLSSTRLSKVVEFLSQKIGIRDEDCDSELFVKSNFNVFLELPWEEITGKNIYVIREVPRIDKIDTKTKGNSLLFLASHAVYHQGVEFSAIQEGLDEEIHSLVCTLKKSARPTIFRFNHLLLSWHATKDFIKSMSWRDYSYVHMVMHGTKKGEILLEEPESHKQADPMESSEFVKILKGHNFKLFFLSFCYSGGSSDKNSLAFELTRNGISKYVIGYSDPVGGPSAKNFAKNFYDFLLNGDKDEYGKDKIESIYKSALERFYTENPRSKYVPLLYTFY